MCSIQALPPIALFLNAMQSCDLEGDGNSICQVIGLGKNGLVTAEFAGFLPHSFVIAALNAAIHGYVLIRRLSASLQLPRVLHLALLLGAKCDDGCLGNNRSGQRGYSDCRYRMCNHLTFGRFD